MPKPTIPEVMPSVISYINKPGNSAGGALHVVICDNNPQDCHVRSCLECATERGDADGVRLAETMLLMSRSQRSRIRKRIDWNTLTERAMDDDRQWTLWTFNDQSTLTGKYWVFRSGTWDSLVELEEWPHTQVSSCWAVCYLPWREGDALESLPPIPEGYR